MYPAAGTIALLTGHTRTTVFGALKELKDNGVIASRGRVRGRYRNAAGPVIYCFLDPPEPMSLYEKDVSLAGTTNPGRRFKAVRGLSPNHQSSLCARDGGSLSRRDAEGHFEVKDEGVGMEGGAGGTGGDARFASPREAAALASPAPVGKADERQALATPVEAHAARFVERGIDPKRARLLADDLVSDPKHREGCQVCAGQRGHVAETVAGSAATGDIPGSIPGKVATDSHRRCEATTQAGLACVGRPLVGSLFCKRHQKRTEALCAPVG